jgi:hypothetical protein
MKIRLAFAGMMSATDRSPCGAAAYTNSGVRYLSGDQEQNRV